MAAAVAARTKESIASFFRIECLSFRKGALGSGSQVLRILPIFLRFNQIHSFRIAEIGSTRAARRAGSQVARRATAASRAAIVAKVRGSWALTP